MEKEPRVVGTDGENDLKCPEEGGDGDSSWMTGSSGARWPNYRFEERFRQRRSEGWRTRRG